MIQILATIAKKKKKKWFGFKHVASAGLNHAHACGGFYFYVNNSQQE